MAVLNGERMHDTMERLLPGARSAALLWQGAAVLGGAALGAGQVYGGAAPFGLALVIGCPPSYCLAAAQGSPPRSRPTERSAPPPQDAAGRQAGRGCRGCRVGAASHRWPHRGRGAGGLPDADGGAGAANRAGGGTFQPGADRHGGVYGAAGRGFWLGVRAFSGAGAARRLPVAGCGYGMLAALCRRALGSGPGAGRGGRAVRGHRRHAGADRRAEHCAGGGHHGVGADTGLRRAGCGAGESGGVLPLPGGAGPLRRGVCGGLRGHWPRPTLPVCCRWRSVPGWALWLRWLCRGACCTKFSRRPRRPCRRRAWAGRRASSLPWRTR